MSLRSLVPAGGPVGLDDRAALLERYALPRPDWVRLNLVTTVSGRTAGADGTSESITTRTDRRILGHIRELADVVLVGAQSVRVEGYQLPRNATLAVLTRSGDLAGHRLDSADGPDSAKGHDAADGRGAIVLGPASAREMAAASTPFPFHELPDDTVATAIGTLRALGFRSIVCEGGPGLAGQLVGSGLLDELCLTTSPRLGGTGLSLLGEAEVDVRLELAGLLADDDGTLFARWRPVA